mmetsp:Transcript_6959/g.15859  ORF Transcript_6959/g.15859 Transcript_6959/m.15859 type:complete len:111 (-) Transcript_6959:93-425(-)
MPRPRWRANIYKSVAAEIRSVPHHCVQGAFFKVGLLPPPIPFQRWKAGNSKFKDTKLGTSKFKTKTKQTPPKKTWNSKFRILSKTLWAPAPVAVAQLLQSHQPLARRTAA